MTITPVHMDWCYGHAIRKAEAGIDVGHLHNLLFLELGALLHDYGMHLDRPSVPGARPFERRP